MSQTTFKHFKHICLGSFDSARHTSCQTCRYISALTKKATVHSSASLTFCVFSTLSLDSICCVNIGWKPISSHKLLCWGHGLATHVCLRVRGGWAYASVTDCTTYDKRWRWNCCRSILWRTLYSWLAVSSIGFWVAVFCFTWTHVCSLPGCNAFQS